VEFHVSLPGRENLTGEIYRQLRQAILEGRLQPGERLPPTRELAGRLTVSRSTVTLAYEQLVAEGFVASRVGAGTFVSAPAARTGQPAQAAAGALQPRPIWDGVPVRAVRTLYDSQPAFDFRTGLPDATRFPYETWRRLMALQWQPSAAGIGTYGDPGGHRGLRRAIARHIGVSRAVQTAAEHVTVTNGAQQALDIVARVLLEPGDPVAVEDPTYPPAWRLLRSLGAEVTAVPVDGEGLVVDALPPGARLVHVTPSHQFPLGAPMSLARRMALLTWAEREGAAIVEDDYDSEFRYGGRPMEPLQSLDTRGRVIYIGSFSKTMLPALRLGFVVSPPSLSEALAATKYVTDWHTSPAVQGAMAEFIDQGWFGRHLRKLRGVYEARHRLIVDTLHERFAHHLEVVPSATGLHVCALARSGSVEEMADVRARAAAAGVEVDPLARYAVQTARAGLLFGYGAIALERIGEGLRRLRECFRE
jgi:GntR family transcriptional regulator/MocR family aminotransferase